MFRYTSPWKTAPIECLETSVTYCQPTPRNIPEQRPQVYVALLRILFLLLPLILLLLLLVSAAVKVKVLLLHAKQQQQRSADLPIINTGARMGRWSAPPLPSFLPPVPMYRRLGGPRDRFGRVRKISLTPGFEPRTVQHIASRYSFSSSSSS